MFPVLIRRLNEQSSMPECHPLIRNRTLSGIDGLDHDLGVHPIRDRVADDPVAEAVLDGAEIQLPLRAAMFAELGQPQPVRGCGGEFPVHRSGCTGVWPAWSGALSSRTWTTTRCPSTAATWCGHRRRIPLSGLVGQEPVAEPGVISVGVEEGVGR